MLLATRDSAVAKKPRFRLSISRSSSVRPSGDFHRAMSACMETSVGIEWLLQPARYLSQAQWYLSGSSWFTSARALIIALSLTLTRAASRAISPSPVLSVSGAVVMGVTVVFPSRWWCARGPGGGGAARPEGPRRPAPRGAALLAGFAVRVVDRAERAGVRVDLRGRGGGRLGGRPGGRRGRRGRGRRGRRDRGGGDRVEPAVGALQGRLLHVRRALRAQVVGGLEALAPGPPVQRVELLPARRGHVQVERLRLVDPLLPARRGVHQPGRVELERGGVELLEVVGHPGDRAEAAVVQLELGDHVGVPQAARLEVAHQVGVDHGEVAG